MGDQYGPVFSPLPSYTEPAAIPSSSSTATALSSSNGSPRSETATIMFSLVIVFLGAFGLCMMGGAAYYRWKAHRRRMEEAALGLSAVGVAKLKPELWEVAVSGPAAAVTEPRHWEDLHPLSVAVDVKTRTLFRPHKLSTSSTAETLIGVAGALIITSRHTCDCAPTPDTMSSLSHRPSTSLTQRTHSAQISVLIAMPSPQSSRRVLRPPHPNLTPSRLSEATSSFALAAGPSNTPGPPSEFAIGTARVTYFTGDDALAFSAGQRALATCPPC